MGRAKSSFEYQNNKSRSSSLYNTTSFYPLIALALAACGGGSSSSPTPPGPAAPVLTVGGTQATLNEGTFAADTPTGYTVSATDADGDTVTLTVTGDSENRFAIDADGNLNIVAGSSFDFDDEQTITLTITATDDSTDELSSTRTVEIAIAEDGGGGSGSPPPPEPAPDRTPHDEGLFTATAEADAFDGTQLDGTSYVGIVSYASSDEAVRVGLQSIVDVDGKAWQVNLMVNAAGIALSSSTADHHVIARDADDDGVWVVETLAALPDSGTYINFGQLDAAGTAFGDTLTGDSILILSNNLFVLGVDLGGGYATGDTITGIDNLVGSGFADRLTGDDNDNEIEGGAGADWIDGGDGADMLEGGAGEDLLTGGAGADTIDGGAEADTASYQFSDAAVTIDLSDAAAESGGHAAGDTLTNIENLVGSLFAADTLTGDDNDNVIEGLGGGDRIDGGAGSDTASYASSNEGVNVHLQSIIDVDGKVWQVDLMSSATITLGASTSNHYIIARDADADGVNDGVWVVETLAALPDSGTYINFGQLNAAGTAFTTAPLGVSVTTLSFGGSNSLVVAGLGLGGGHATGDRLSNIENLIGSVHDDTLTGDANANAIDGGDGNDLLTGGDGADRLDGGAGVDTASYASSTGAVTINLADAAAESGGHAAGDTLTGIENLIGSAFADTLTGDDNDNVIEGGVGADTIIGGAGVDTASYASTLIAGVTVNLADGTATGGDAAGDTLTGIENLIGSAFDDVLTGSTGNNVLDGGASGSDTLDGGTTGSTESDTYVLRLLKDGTDTVTRFNGEDKIRVGLSQDDVTAINAATDSLAELYARADLTIDNSGADTNIAITNEDGNIMVLQGYTDALTFDDFDLVASSDII